MLADIKGLNVGQHPRALGLDLGLQGWTYSSRPGFTALGLDLELQGWIQSRRAGFTAPGLDLEPQGQHPKKPQKT